MPSPPPAAPAPCASGVLVVKVGTPPGNGTAEFHANATPSGTEATPSRSSNRSGASALAPDMTPTPFPDVSPASASGCGWAPV